LRSDRRTSLSGRPPASASAQPPPGLRSPAARLATLLLCFVGTGAPAAEPRVLSAHTDSVYSLAFSPDGDTLAVAAFGTEVVQLWSLASGAPVGRLSGHDRPVVSVRFTPDGKTLASRDYGGVVRLWRVEPARKEP
jgi:WD40 repeat protein